MGNSAPTGLRVGMGDGDRPCKVQLGDAAAIQFDERMDYSAGLQRWGMSYKVGESSCAHYLLLESIDHESVEIRIRPDPTFYLYCIRVCKAEAGLFQVTSSKALRSSFSYLDKEPTYFTCNASGGITETFLEHYESGASRGLLVSEWNKKTSVDKPYKGTVTHYYANSKNRRDVGLSVAVKRIRVTDDRFDFVVDGPHQHPVHALLYMFDEVRRTGIWKPTYCPHCANSVIQRHRFSYQSDTDDNNNVNNVSSPPLRGGRMQNAGGLLGNYGSTFTGNNNGKVEIQNFQELVHIPMGFSRGFGFLWK